jgi:hypothetical protein
MEKKITSHFVKGLVIGLVMVAISVVFQILDIHDKWMQWLVLCVFAVAIAWSCISFSKDMDGNVTFGKVFGHGFKTAAIVTIISIAAFLITYMIMPEIKDKAMQIARTEMEKNPQMTEEMIDKAIGWTSKYFVMFGVLGSMFSYALIGIIASLIGAAIAKKNPNPEMPQTM